MGSDLVVKPEVMSLCETLKLSLRQVLLDSWIFGDFCWRLARC